MFSLTVVSGPCHSDMYHQTASKSVKDYNIRFTSGDTYEHVGGWTTKYCGGQILQSGRTWTGGQYAVIGDSAINLLGQDLFGPLQIEELSDEGHVARLTGEGSMSWTYCCYRANSCEEERTVDDTSNVVLKAR